MSRRQGRFSTHQNAGESLQRQLTAPAHKWRKAWVAPTGSQPEASYKICRYVKVGKDDKDVEDETNGDEEDEEEGEGEGEGDGEEEEEEDGDEEEGDEKVVATPAVDTPAGTEPVPGESTAPTPAAPAPSSDPAAEATVPTPIAPPSSDPLPESTPPTLPTASTETPSTAEHTAIPSNAIELTNTAPNHVADGSTTTTTGGIELTQSHDQSSSSVEPTVTAVGSLGQNEDKMEVDSPVIEKDVAIEEDAGLVMGEMTPPVGQKELELEKTELDTVKETESAPVGQVTEEQKPEEITVDEKTKEVAAEQPPALE